MTTTTKYVDLSAKGLRRLHKLATAAAGRDTSRDCMRARRDGGTLEWTHYSGGGVGHRLSVTTTMDHDMGGPFTRTLSVLRTTTTDGHVWDWHSEHEVITRII